MPNVTLAHSPASKILGALSAILRSRGLSTAAVIDDHLFFYISHSPVLQCAPFPHGASADTQLRPVARDEDLEEMNLADSVRQFIQNPDLFCAQSKGYVRAFMASWTDEVAAASCAPDLVHQIVDALLEVEYWLSNDGPGACVLVRDWVIWTAGRHGMSDLHFARNLGDRPCPDMSTVNRWDSVSQLTANDIGQLSQGLAEWKQSPSVWSFRNRLVPQRP